MKMPEVPSPVDAVAKPADADETMYKPRAAVPPFAREKKHRYQPFPTFVIVELIVEPPIAPVTPFRMSKLAYATDSANWPQ